MIMKSENKIICRRKSQKGSLFFVFWRNNLQSTTYSFTCRHVLVRDCVSYREACFNFFFNCWILFLFSISIKTHTYTIIYLLVPIRSSQTCFQYFSYKKIERYLSETKNRLQFPCLSEFQSHHHTLCLLLLHVNNIQLQQRSNNFHGLTIKTKRIMGLKLVQIQVQTIMTCA